MFERAFQRAVTNLAKAFSTRYGTGRLVGSALAGTAIIAPVTKTIRKQIRGQTQEVNAEKQGEIHAHESEGINTDGNGHLIAAVYEGDDGVLYKLDNNGWQQWDGSEWR